MRIARSILLAGLLPFATALHAAGDTPSKILEKAVTAHGGRVALGKLKMAQIKSTMKGSAYGLGEIDLTVEDTFHLPMKFKKTLIGKGAGKDLRISWAIDGSKSWYKENDKPAIDLEGKGGADGHYHPLSFLETLLSAAAKEKDLHLLKEQRARDRTLLVVEQRRPGESSLAFSFDKDTGLLAKTKQKQAITIPDPDGKLEKRAVIIEGEYLSYKKIDGLNVPTRHVIHHDGKKTMEMTILSVKLLDKIDDDVFKKP